MPTSDSLPEWLSATQALGVPTVVGIVVGALVTNFLTSRREGERWRREIADRREQRSFDKRREVYVDFQRGLVAARERIFAFVRGEEPPTSDGRLPPDWWRPAAEPLEELRLLAPRLVVDLAEHTYYDLTTWGRSARHGQHDLDVEFTNMARHQQYDDALAAAMRHDLGVTEAMEEAAHNFLPSTTRLIATPSPSRWDRLLRRWLR